MYPTLDWQVPVQICRSKPAGTNRSNSERGTKENMPEQSARCKSHHQPPSSHRAQAKNKKRDQRQEERENYTNAEHMPGDATRYKNTGVRGQRSLRHRLPCLQFLPRCVGATVRYLSTWDATARVHSLVSATRLFVVVRIPRPSPHLQPDVLYVGREAHLRQSCVATAASLSTPESRRVASYSL